ncbi:MAG TPA: hypothetical protein VGP71_07280 [Burkholderiales bacterium]|jgi:hypothetical protein|nr:hypothetical protein [Burkholderiales bacterium]
MHCELVVPALFAAHEIPRLPSLELLLARGRAAHADSLSLEAWLAEGFDLAEGPLPAGAITAQADGTGHADRNPFWLRADPVHLRLGRARVTLIPGIGCNISRDDAIAFVAALNGHFGAEYLFVMTRPEQWCLRTPAEGALDSLSPLELAGQEVDTALPRGAEAARWHALMNEIQMVLHEHPLNAERERRGDPSINSVWLWGAGRLPAAAHAPWHSVTADDALAAGLARMAGIRQRALTPGAGEWLEGAPHEGRHLVVLDSLRAALVLGGADSHVERLTALESRWFAPLLEALRADRIGMVTVQVPDSGHAYETVRSDLRRFWRRARPLAAYA